MSSANEPRPTDPPARIEAHSGHTLPPQRVLMADDLFVGEREVLIQNGPEVYRLRRTRNGKLILCK